MDPKVLTRLAREDYGPPGDELMPRRMWGVWGRSAWCSRHVSDSVGYVLTHASNVWSRFERDLPAACRRLRAADAVEVETLACLQAVLPGDVAELIAVIVAWLR